ncbi:tetratricopeptide repeat protein [Catenulispora rubra]|uniref:tetratricopeptide repeat protein n=1 Tax=Catenulispora rubra TaxID=280293 RepID=UPI00189208FC|nr:tetratricopeptide repeat protein [Catenulispora rubra]
MIDAGGEANRGAVDNDVSGSVHSLVQGRSFDNATINFFGSAPPRPIGTPAMLPPSYGPYTDRIAVHERLDQFADREVGMVQLGGVAGVGKSATALRYLRSRSERYRGGVYYADLGGGRSGRGVSVADALDSWLVAKGVLPADVPPSLAARSALFRQMTADAPVAVLIDDPVSTAQVTPLCPTSEGSLIMVTAHHELGGIRTAHGAEFLRVPMLEHDYALELLAGLVGAERLHAEQEAFDQLAAFSEGHPLMLRVIAAELNRGRWDTAEELALQLADTRSRLQAADQIMASGGDYSVNAALELSVRGLSEPGRVLLRALASHPGAEFGADLVAFLGADSGALADLVESGLVTPLHETGAPRFLRRWRLHTLVQDFVRREAASDLTASIATEKAIIGWYLRRTAVADRARSPRWHIGPDFTDEPPFEDAVAAVRWLEAEQANLRSAVIAASDSGDHGTVWQLCEVLWGLYFWSNAFGDWIDTHQLGIESAMRLGDRAAEGRIRLQLGFAYYNQDDIDQAAAEFASAVPAAEDSGMAKLLAAAIESVGLADLRLGRPRQALDAFDQVLALVEADPEAGPAAVGNVQRHRARALGALGRQAEAIAIVNDHAIPAYEADGNSAYNLARTLVDLSDLLIAGGRADEAVEHVHLAIAEFGRLRNPLQGAVALTTLASAYEALGDIENATNALLRAAEVYEALGSLKAPDVRARAQALQGGVES